MFEPPVEVGITHVPMPILKLAVPEEHPARVPIKIFSEPVVIYLAVVLPIPILLHPLKAPATPANTLTPKAVLKHPLTLLIVSLPTLVFPSAHPLIVS